MGHTVILLFAVILSIASLLACILYFRPFRAWLGRLPNGIRIPVLGFGRLVCVLTGVKGSSIHSAASLYILFAGFVVEVVILEHFLIDKSQPVRVPGSETDAIIGSIIFLLLLPLFAHQFMIFRNFTLGHHLAPSPISSTYTLGAQRGTNSKLATPPGRRAFAFVRFAQGTIEFFIYLAFGIISGEAGYLYSLGSVNNSRSPVFEWVRDHVLQTTSLQQALEGLFVMGALIVCLLVFTWDILVAISMCFRVHGAAVRERYGRVIGWFFVLDMFSIVVWSIIGSFMFQGLSQLHGWPSDYGKFMRLFAIALLYLVSNLVRVGFGIVRLGKAASFDESQALAI